MHFAGGARRDTATATAGPRPPVHDRLDQSPLIPAATPWRTSTVFEGAVLRGPQPGDLRPPTLPGPRAGAASLDLLY
jgi:hypothetical protein